ncbi:retrovirus-related pol polyprotein from transposon TNT 1-94 [Tanacetum coccineum]
MTSLVEFMMLSGADNHPPMLEKDLYDSWQSRMVLYMENREHGRKILESVKNGPLIWPTIEENGVTRTKTYEELSTTKKIQADCDVKATNIILQGLPSDVYALQFQVNTKFLNSLPPEWSKFITDVKLVRDLHTTNFDQLHAYLQQHEIHGNEVRIMRERNQDPFALIDSGLAVLVFKQGDDPIDAINKMMSFMSTVERRSSFATGTLGIGGSNSGQQRVIKCFNCQGESHMARQCPKPKRKRDATWFRDKVLLVEAQGACKVLNEEELAFLADPGVAEGPVSQTVITHNAAYQAFDLDAFDYDCNEISTAQAVLMANLSSYGSDVLSEVPHSEYTHNDLLNQSVQEMNYFEQTHFVNHPETEINSDSNIILYSRYLLETQNVAVQDTNSFTQQDAMILSVFEQLSNQVTNYKKVNKDNLIANESLSAELETYKNQEKEDKNIDKEIDLEKKVKELDNINPFYLKKAQQIRPMLYDGNVITKETNVISIADSEETLILEEESRSKMDFKQSDPMVLEKKVNTKPINYVALNRLSKDFGKCFVPQALFDKQALWLQNSYPITDQSASLPVKIEAPRELPKNNTSVSQTKPTFDQLFELNNLKTELQAKDTTIKKLKANIKRLNKTSTTNSVKKDIDEIETINIELEHRVAKLMTENEHLKQTYKQLYDSIKPSRVHAKEYTESLVNQLNQKSIEITDLNDLLQEKFLAITALETDLRKLKGKDIVKNNREAHIYYLQHTMEQAVILREIVEGANSLNPLDSASYSAFKFLRSNDEAPDAIIKCIKNIQNGVVERRNRALMEAARIMLIFSKALLFLWAEAINTACYNQNRSLIRLHYNKTPYELMHDKKPVLSFLYVFDSLCYPTNDSEDLGKLNAKADIGIVVGYAPAKKAFRIYNRRTWKIMESIHVTFDELTSMASEQFSLGPGLQFLTPATSSSGLVPNHIPQQPCNPPKRDDWGRLFQPMFDKYFNTLTIVVSLVPVDAEPRTVDIADSHVSMSIDQDAPSTSITST